MPPEDRQRTFGQCLASWLRSISSNRPRSLGSLTPQPCSSSTACGWLCSDARRACAAPEPAAVPLPLAPRLAFRPGPAPVCSIDDRAIARVLSVSCPRYLDNRLVPVVLSAACVRSPRAVGAAESLCTPAPGLGCEMPGRPGANAQAEGGNTCSPAVSASSASLSDASSSSPVSRRSPLVSHL